MTQSSVDILIAGGGMVGSMLAAALGTLPNGPSVWLVDAHKAQAFDPGSNPDYDLRVSALNHASMRMLEKVDAWPHVVARRSCPFTSMCVWNQQQDAKTLFEAAHINEHDMGHIVENRVIQLALHDQIATKTNVTLKCPDSLHKLRVESSHVAVQLGSGETINTKLLIGADGANSVVRDQANIAINRDKYDQHALVATVQLAQSHGNMTWQRFVPTGPQALLPLTDARASIVWYHNKDEIMRLLALNDEDFSRELMAAFPEELGNVASILQRGSFPLAKAHAESYVKDRIALIGDAAHTVHPLAGQGVNLGMLDAAVLFDVIDECLVRGQDYADARHLRKYQRWRRGENSLMINILDGFYRAFGSQPGPIEAIRDSALRLVDDQQTLKKVVMRYATGSGGSLPRLATR
jgi:2-octaprenyl-3-methyl-6-methoxy-1,4-benzoquinol hydroxylase